MAIFGPFNGHFKVRISQKSEQIRYNSFSLKERCQAKFLEGHLNELGLLIGPHKSARFVWANQEA